MNKKQQVISRLQNMDVGDNFSYIDFKDIVSKSYFNTIMSQLEKLEKYVWPDNDTGWGLGKGQSVLTVYTLTDNNIPLPETAKRKYKPRKRETRYTNRFTIMVDDELDRKIKNLPEGERSEFVRDAIKNHFN